MEPCSKQGRDGEAVFESTTYQGVLWVQIHGLPPLNMTIATANAEGGQIERGGMHRKIGSDGWFSNMNYSQTIVLRVDVLAILQVHVRLDWMEKNGRLDLPFCELEAVEVLRGRKLKLTRRQSPPLSSDGNRWTTGTRGSCGFLGWRIRQPTRAKRKGVRSTRYSTRYFSRRGKEGISALTDWTRLYHNRLKWIRPKF
ncbi:unnamed protein product [Prunus armeniaca]|uniref:Uncharacterized protein n=1 Tax=Prunus armeniaca TaxID=36596 RepID=A0A6J5XDZ7_PRUAR|nr:unnamed protein product [Prunus armeniaca]CAB4309108.1 unnamed protein product [Prunus armeniaca]